MTGAAPSAIEVRPPSPEELEAFFAHHDRIYGRAPDPRVAEAWSTAFDCGRSLLAHRAGRLVGVAGGCSARLRTPGGSLPAVVLSYLTVDPSERRRGLSVELLRRQYEESAARGEPIAAFVTSRGSPYARIGAGVIAWSANVTLDNAQAQLIPVVPDGTDEPDLVVEPWADAWADRLTDVYNEATARRAGTLELSRDWWRAYRRELELRPEPQFLVVASRAGTPCGYALYTVDESWPDGVPSNIVTVHELHADAASTRRELWQHILTTDLAATTVVQHLPIDDPLRWLLREPRELRVRGIRDLLWARILDLPAVLAGRRYRGSGTVVVEVLDRFMPQNAGCWRLDVADGLGQATRTDDAHAATIGIGDLASLLTGAATFSALCDAGRIAVRNASAAQLPIMFGVDDAPWSAVVV